MAKRSSLLPALLILLAWGALSVFLADQGVFRSTPDRPPLVFLTATLLPPILFGLVYATSAGVRSYVLGLDLRFLTAVQGWRVIGGMFLVLMTHGLVPETFAWPAGVGDLIVGFYAPFVVLAVSRRTPGWRTQVVLLNVLGLLDFVGALGAGVLSGNNPLGVLRGPVTTDIFQSLPLSLIPAFMVPVWIIVHVVSLLKLRHIGGAGGEDHV